MKPISQVIFNTNNFIL